MSNLNIRYELQRLEEVHFDIVTQCKILKQKREKLNRDNEMKDVQTVWMMESWSTVEAVEHKEMEMLADMKNQHVLDALILKLYQKVLALQSSKIESITKKLEYLIQKNVIDACPIEYTVQSYQEWTRTNPKIHALQSEILDLLAKKIKCFRSIIGDEAFAEKSQKFQLSIDKLRSKTYFFLERDPLVDTDFTLHISNIVNQETTSFESRKINEFVASCWSSYNETDLQFDYASHYQQFVGALTQHMVTKYGYMRRSGHSKIDLTCDQIFAIVEGNVIPTIFTCIFKKTSIDETIYKQCLTLKSLTQKEIGIKEEFIDLTSHPFHEAIEHLKLLPIVMLPTQKLRQIILSAQSVMKQMTDVCAIRNGVAGADEFMDVWVYVVIQAGIKHLFSNINYLQNYCNPSYMFSETGYYLSSLELAAQFIRTIQKKEFALNTEFLIATVEKDRLIGINGIKYMKDVVITGYALKTCLAWIKDSNSLLNYTMERDKDSTTNLTLSVFSINETVKSLLYHKSYKACVTFEKLEDFYLPSIRETNYSPLISISSCKPFHEQDQVIRNYSNCLNLGLENNRVTELQADMKIIEKELIKLKDKFKNVFHACWERNINHIKDIFFKRENKLELEGSEGCLCTIENVVGIIIEQLTQLNYYSKYIPPSKFYTSYVTYSVKLFQQNENKLNEGNGVVLRTDGVCDSISFERLLQKQ